ncbi:MAG: DUF6489 family protein [Pelagimonas sp.]|jgi:hypothetical protein|nr:DUF6489 family protein [Pelagimonas sp.]
MKISIDFDLTPAEFREAMGLPEVKSIQDRWLNQVETALSDEIAKLSPETIAQQWASALVPNPDMFASFLNMMPGMADKK